MTPNDDLEERAGRRLRRALEGEVRQFPLPENFVAAVVPALAQSGRGRGRPIPALPLMATLVGAAIALVVILNSVSGPQRTGPGTSGTDSAASALASGSDGPEALTHFVSDYSGSLTLDYPSSWRVIAARNHWYRLLRLPACGRHGRLERSLCYRSADARRCRWRCLLPGRLHRARGRSCGCDFDSGGPPIVPGLSAPPGVIRLPGGLEATAVEGPTTSVWNLLAGPDVPAGRRRALFGPGRGATARRSPKPRREHPRGSWAPGDLGKRRGASRPPVSALERGDDRELDVALSGRSRSGSSPWRPRRSSGTSPGRCRARRRRP